MAQAADSRIISDLKDIPTDFLTKVLRERLVEANDPVWPYEVFLLFAALGILPCVDAFPVRIRDNKPEMGFILRNTGFYKGSWWDIGGRMNIGESFSQALNRHVRETLGVGFRLLPGQSWNSPAYLGQYGPKAFSLSCEESENAGHEPSKWCISPTWLIDLESEDFIFGSTAHGGQEARELHWFDLDRLPYGKLGYSGDTTVRACADWIRNNE